MRVDRYDTARIDAVERLPSGGILVQATPTRTGIFAYTQPDGSIRRELRHPDDVFDASYLASFRGAPVTRLHPSGMIDAKNRRELSVGHVDGKASRLGDSVSTEIVVHDEAMISDVLGRKFGELSCGYQCDHDDTPGTYNGQAYDTRQMNMVINHVAIGPAGWGRMGPGASLRLDSNGSEIRNMKLKIDGKEHDIDTAQAAIDAQAAKFGAMSADLAVAQKQIKDSASTDPKKLGDMVIARVKLVRDLKKVYDHAGAKFDEEEVAASSGTDIELIRAALKVLAPGSAASESTDDAFVRGYFARTIEDISSELSGPESVQPPVEPPASAVPPPTQDAGASIRAALVDSAGPKRTRTVAEARQDMIDRHNKAADLPWTLTRKN